MKVPLHIAEKLQKLSLGDTIPDSSAKHSIINDLVDEGIIERKGRIKKTLYLYENEALFTYLKNKHSINNLSIYIDAIKKENSTRSEMIAAASDSKLKTIRTFKGFLINSYIPIKAKLNEQTITVEPVNGIFQFIYDFENFSIPKDVIIVGIENPENFRYVEKEKYLFNDIKPLFVSRYPQGQSRDLLRWLRAIPNNYVHFGDFDLSGIGIYLNECKIYLKERAHFYIPDDIEQLIKKYGNRKGYNVQKLNFDVNSIQEEGLTKLIGTIHKYRKGLEQEVLINRTN